MNGLASLFQWQWVIYVGIVSCQPKCVLCLSEHQTMPRNQCQKFPCKWVPYGFNQNNSLALSEFIHNCCIFVDCTVVWLHASLNVFVLKLTLPSKVILQRVCMCVFFRNSLSHILYGVWQSDVILPLFPIRGVDCKVTPHSGNGKFMSALLKWLKNGHLIWYME